MDWRDRTIFPFYRQKRTLPEATRLRLFKEIDALNRAGKYIRIPAWRDSNAASVRKTETIPAADKMAATANKSCKWFAAGFTRGKKIIADTRELQRATGYSGVEQAVDSSWRQANSIRWMPRSSRPFDHFRSNLFQIERGQCRSRGARAKNPSSKMA